MKARSVSFSPKGAKTAPFIMVSMGEPASESSIRGAKIVSLTESNQLSGSRVVSTTFASG